jgi:hypothetical protein
VRICWRRRDLPDPIRLISYRQVAPYVYEVTTESVRHGRVTQRILVLPDGASRGGRLR